MTVILMRWNAFDLVGKSVKKTQQLLFPIKFRYWMKLGFVSLLSKNSGSFLKGNNGLNFSVPSSNKDVNSVTGNAISNLSEKSYIGILGLIMGVGVILALIWSFITSVFTFIFIDALVKKDYKIKKSWKENKGNGASFFGFRIVTALINLAVIGLIFLPLILSIIDVGLKEFISTISFSVFLSFMISIIFAVIWLLLFGIFIGFVLDFALPEMYRQGIGIIGGIKRMWENIKVQKVESLVYLVAKIALGIVVGLISLIALIPVGLVFLILGLIILVPLWFISKILMFIFLVPVFLLFIYAFNVVVLPLNVFLKYFSLLVYEKLFRVKLFR
jgi:hypothetical protein